TGRRIFPSASGFELGTVRILPTASVMLNRQLVPTAVGMSSPPQTTASGASVIIKIAIFILRLGKCENSRSVNVTCVRHAFRHEMASFVQQPCDEILIHSKAAVAPCAKASGPWILAATILGSSMA